MNGRSVGTDSITRAWHEGDMWALGGNWDVRDEQNLGSELVESRK